MGGAMALRPQLGGRDAGINEQTAHRLGAMARQDDIGGRIAGGVGVSVDMHLRVGRQFFDQRRCLAQDGLAGVGNRRAAGIEMDGVFIQDRDEIRRGESRFQPGERGRSLFVSAADALAPLAAPLIVRAEP